MNQATLGEDGDHVRGVLVVAPPFDSKLGCSQTDVERATRTATSSRHSEMTSTKIRSHAERMPKLVNGIFAIQFAQYGLPVLV